MGTFCIVGLVGRAVVACGISATLLWAAAASADDALERALSLVSQERYSEARKAFEPLLKRAPDAPRVLLLHGILEADAGNTREAVAIFERVQSDHPDMFEPYNNLAVLHAREGRLDAARDALLAALQRRPNAVAYANLGDVYLQLADRAYSRAREAGSDERAAHERLAAQSESSAAAVPKNRTCVRAEQFKDRTAAKTAAEWLRSRDAEAVQVHHRVRHVVTSYRVYLPAFPSTEAAKAKLSELRGRGISDALVLRKGARANEISLGVYKSGKNARRRVAQLKKLGYPVKSEPNKKILSEYLVEALVGGDRPELDNAWTAKFPGHAISNIECP